MAAKKKVSERQVQPPPLSKHSDLFREKIGARILLTSNEEHADQLEAAAEVGVTWQMWARAILAHASGRYDFGDQLKRAEKAAVRMMAASISGKLKTPEERKKALVPKRRK